MGRLPNPLDPSLGASTREKVVPLLLGTEAVYALADGDDGWHVRVRDFLKAEHQTLLVPVAVIPEVAYPMRRRLGPAVETRLAESLAARELAIESLILR